ncbi:MAG: cupin domain-containing protein [Gammaproteobacteria bacterium]
MFDLAHETFASEVFEELVKSEHVRVERILSKGHASPEFGWYDQDENEWVIVLQGGGRLTFEDGTEVELSAGDYINLPAHKKHRVTRTDPEQVTVWLAVFYK